MNIELQNAHVLLTGASGGIGSEVCNQLLKQNATVIAITRDIHKLDKFSYNSLSPKQFSKIEADITTQHGREIIKKNIEATSNRINVLINCAGCNLFSSIENLKEKDVIQQVNTNLVAPILLIKTMLPTLKAQPKAKIINVGSSLDSIGFPGFSLYSATKFGLRGFSEALRRELSDTNIEVNLVSPRATNTEMNSSKIREMNKSLKVRMDNTEEVAKIILKSIQGSGSETYIGWPEKLFTRINRVLPSVVDSAIAKQLPIIKQYF